MEFIDKFLGPIYVYFQDLYYLLGGISVLSILVFIWAYFALLKVLEQRDSDTNKLKELPKIWAKAKFLPEEDRATESKKLFVRFMDEVEANQGVSPVIIENASPRTMTMSEYEEASKIKSVQPFSLTLLIISAVYGLFVILANRDDIAFGLVIAGIVIALQIVFLVVISALNSKNIKHRKELFKGLERTGPDFFRITRQYILQVNHPEFVPTGASVSTEMPTPQPAPEPQPIIILAPTPQPIIAPEPEPIVVEETPVPMPEPVTVIPQPEEIKPMPMPTITPAAPEPIPTPEPTPAAINIAPALLYRPEPKPIPQQPTQPTSGGFSNLASLAREREPQGTFSVDAIGDALEQEIARRRAQPPTV